MSLLLFAALLGLIPALVASSKGKSFILWWIYGTALFIVALPHSLLTKADQRGLDQQAAVDGKMKKCPMCAELVRAEALKCRYCGFEFVQEPTVMAISPNATPPSVASRTPNEEGATILATWAAVVLAILIVVAVIIN